MIVSVALLAIAVILACSGVYYAAAAVIAGWLIISHRELWSLVKNRKLPPTDERVEDNVMKAMRNSFVFFFVVASLLLVFYLTDENQPIQLDIKYFLSGLLLLVGIV
jgi:hypothetical protein